MSNELIPYQEVEKMSIAFAKSGLFGVKTPEQALALMLLAQAEGLHPAIAARDYHIIQGRPAKKSEAMLTAFINAGGSVKWHALTDDKADATFSHPQGGEVRIDWTQERAKKAGLTSKDGSMYLRYPRQMLRARCISEGVRTIYPAATGGMYVPEEIPDTIDVYPVMMDKTKSRLDNIIDAQVTPSVEPPPEQVVTPEPGTNPAPSVTEGVIAECKFKSGETNGKKWVKYGVKIGEQWYGTFDTKIYEACLELKSHGSVLCSVEYGEDKFGRELLAIRAKSAEEMGIPI